MERGSGKGAYSAPIEVNAVCKLLNPNNMVYSSVAVDAPAHVRELSQSEDAE